MNKTQKDWLIKSMQEYMSYSKNNVLDDEIKLPTSDRKQNR